MRKKIKGECGFNYHPISTGWNSRLFVCDIIVVWETLAQFSLKSGFADGGCTNELICFLEVQELLKIHLYSVYMY